MITSIHTLLYSDDPAATRQFLRDVLGWPAILFGESGEGWLIFRSGPSEMGVHPTHGVWEGSEFHNRRHHEISLMCDDIVATRAELESKGATFVGGVEDRGYGLVSMLNVPGTDAIQLYQPSHQTAYDM